MAGRIVMRLWRDTNRRQMEASLWSCRPRKFSRLMIIFSNSVWTPTLEIHGSQSSGSIASSAGSQVTHRRIATTKRYARVNTVHINIYYIQCSTPLKSWIGTNIYMSTKTISSQFEFCRTFFSTHNIPQCVRGADWWAGKCRFTPTDHKGKQENDLFNQLNQYETNKFTEKVFYCAFKWNF